MERTTTNSLVPFQPFQLGRMKLRYALRIPCVVVVRYFPLFFFFFLGSRVYFAVVPGTLELNICFALLDYLAITVCRSVFSLSTKYAHLWNEESDEALLVLLMSLRKNGLM